MYNAILKNLNVALHEKTVDNKSNNETSQSVMRISPESLVVVNGDHRFWFTELNHGNASFNFSDK